jgi:hypothetical protein
MPDEPEQIELVPEGMKVKSGEVMYGDGRVSPVVWIEAEGRRLHTEVNDHVLVFIFLSPEDAQEHAVTIIKEVATLELQLHNPFTTKPPDG